MPEKWRDIENYEGLYQISNYGRIRSFPRKGTSSYLRIDVDEFNAEFDKWIETLDYD